MSGRSPSRFDCDCEQRRVQPRSHRAVTATFSFVYPCLEGATNDSVILSKYALKSARTDRYTHILVIRDFSWAECVFVDYQAFGRNQKVVKPFKNNSFY